MSEPTITAGKLLTADEVAELLGVKRQRVYALSRLWFDSGRRRGIPTVPLSERTYRYRSDAIDRWTARLENGEAEA